MPAAVRPIALDDGPVLARLLTASRSFMAPWDADRDDDFFTAAWQTEEVRALIEAREADSALPFVVLDDAGEVVGRIAVRHIVRGAAQTGTLGYWVAEAANGRGYATRAVAAVLDAAFGEARLHRVQAETLVDNVRSQRVLERNGFERIGLAPELMRIAGRWRDHVLWQRLNPADRGAAALVDRTGVRHGRRRPDGAAMTTTSSTDAPARATVTGAHLVGSVHLPTADDVFRAAAGALGDRLPRIPDGEVGERYYWLQFQTSRFDATPGLVRVGDEPILIRERFDQRPFALDGSVAAEDLAFPDLGYAAAALDSYGRFAALQEQGVVPAGTRFQVSLPTPAAVVGVFFVPDVRAAVEPVYARALYGELDRILAGIPHDRLAVQWDNAVEFLWLEHVVYAGHPQVPWWDDVLGGIAQRAAEEAAHVPEDVALGFHLCYGDVEEQHFVQPEDAGTIAAMIRALLRSVRRRVNWIHLPVPIGRDDAGYFAPLEGLEVPEATEISLGLVHQEDGVEGALRRIAAAATAVPRFSIATECGLGRGPEGRMVADLELHRAVLDAAG